jgi:hypothetical protein
MITINGRIHFVSPKAADERRTFVEGSEIEPVIAPQMTPQPLTQRLAIVQKDFQGIRVGTWDKFQIAVLDYETRLDD